MGAVPTQTQISQAGVGMGAQVARAPSWPCPRLSEFPGWLVQMPISQTGWVRIFRVGGRRGGEEGIWILNTIPMFPSSLKLLVQ